MAWNHEVARERIQKHLNTAPEVDDNITLAEHFDRAKAEIARAKAEGRFPGTRAVRVDGAHLYSQLLGFDELVADGARGETESSHQKVLRFLHAHYEIWDALCEEDEALRVDFHGPRLHAVIVSPANNPRAQVLRAIALAKKLEEAAKRVGRVHGFPTAVRSGIDHGTCLALTTGRAHDTDTLFLGRPANHAAKLLHADPREGIYLTPNAQGIAYRRTDPLDEVTKARRWTEALEEAASTFRFAKLDAAIERVVSETGTSAGPTFRFFRPPPPLKNTRFKDLMPSRTARMGMASLFADVDGYTAFVDNAIAMGGGAIKTAATGIHVIREELNSVLRDDCGGKRVRFIGDCIHGLMTKGQEEDDPSGAIEDAVVCASAMKSSFDLCLDAVPGLDTLDLAIGIEYGPVPLTRVGRKGAESIRCAAGKAVIDSERMQQSIEHGGTRLGPIARSVAAFQVRKHFEKTDRIPEYDDALNLLGLSSAPVVQILRSEPDARSHLKQ